jgi:hypothetical protein
VKLELKEPFDIIEGSYQCFRLAETLPRNAPDGVLYTRASEWILSAAEEILGWCVLVEGTFSCIIEGGIRWSIDLDGGNKTFTSTSQPHRRNLNRRKDKVKNDIRLSGSRRLKRNHCDPKKPVA